MPGRKKTGGLWVGALSLTALVAAGPGNIPGPSESPVADAAQDGDRARVRSLLRDGVDVNAAQGDGMTALHWAAVRGDAEMAAMLLYAGANVKAATRIGAFSPLFLAARNGSAAVVETLLKSGSDANGRTSTGATPLMMAARSGSAQAVRLLLEHGAEVDATESAKGETALMFAAAYNQAAVIDVLMKRGADPKVTTKVEDLSALAKEMEESARRRRQEGRGGGRPPAGGQRSQPQRGEPPSAAPPPAAAQALEATGRTPNDEGTARRGDDRNFLVKLFTLSWLRPKRPAPPQERGLNYLQLVGSQGGLTALLFAARQGHRESVETLLDAGADVNEVSAGDKTTPLLIATINGHFDLARYLLDRGADPRLASDAGATPLYAAINMQWAPKTLYPQPRAYVQQNTTYLDLMKALLDKGADPNVRLKKKIWYSGYNFDLSGVDEGGATPFWRAAYASDVDAMKLLVAHGADPNLPTVKPAGRPRTGDEVRETKDVSGVPPVPVGGPAVTPLHAAAGVGYGEGFAANSHRNHPAGWLPAVKYLVEELGADVNARDHEGNTALHHAAARGDNEVILYLISKGAVVTVVNREGQTTADMANGPVQRVQPFPETVALLMKLGSKNSNKCVSC